MKLPTLPNRCKKKATIAVNYAARKPKVFLVGNDNELAGLGRKERRSNRARRTDTVRRLLEGAVRHILDRRIMGLLPTSQNYATSVSTIDGSTARDILHVSRSLLVGALFALVGCSSQPRADAAPCQVCSVSGELTRGLVRIDQGLERNLLSQLPDGGRYGDYCWYQTPRGTLEAQPRLRVFSVGYEFERRDDHWYLLRELQDAFDSAARAAEPQR